MHNIHRLAGAHGRKQLPGVSMHIGRCNKYIFKGLLSVICSMVFVLVPYLQLGEVLEENL
jgi:hypothetical protein